MAINVKKLKRVIQVNEPLKVLNSGDKKPAFRQNGYGLTLDSTNSDYLDIDTQVGWVNLSDVDFSVKVDLKTVSSLNQPVYCDGNFNQTTTGILRLYIKPNGTLLNIYISGISNSNNVALDYNLGTLGVKEIGMNGVDLLVDGVVVHTFTDRNIDLTSTLYKPTLGRFSYPTPLYFANFDYHNCSINNEQFNFTESRGTTTTGSLGTIATINTSNAGGVQYLDSTVWNKKSFALGLDSANGEYLLVDSNSVITSLSQFQFEIHGDFFINGVTSQLCGRGGSGASGGLIAFTFLGSGTLLFELTDENGVIVVSTSLGTYTAQELINATFTFTNSVLYYNGVQTADLSAYNSSVLSIPQSRQMVICRLSYLSSRFLSSNLFNIIVQTEQFNLTEGLGNQVYGSNGTIGTINTANAQGIERTNYGQWLKGDDTNGWNPYT